jgi:acetyltransferase
MVMIRPIRREDERLMMEFHGDLSEESVYRRYMTAFNLDQRVAHERLSHVCSMEGGRELVLVAERRDPASGQRKILGVGRLSLPRPGERSGEVSLLVADEWQGQGLGTALLRRLLGAAREDGLSTVRADILAENVAMQKLCGEAGFRLSPDPDGKTILAELDLKTA